MLQQIVIDVLNNRDLVMSLCALITGMIINEVGHWLFG